MKILNRIKVGDRIRFAVRHGYEGKGIVASGRVHTIEMYDGEMYAFWNYGGWKLSECRRIKDEDTE